MDWDGTVKEEGVEMVECVLIFEIDKGLLWLFEKAMETLVIGSVIP